MGNQSGRAGTNTREQAAQQIRAQRGGTIREARRAVSEAFGRGAGRGENRAQRRRNIARSAQRGLRRQG